MLCATVKNLLTPRAPAVPLFHYLTCVVFFFNDTAPTEIYTLSLHDALPIFSRSRHDAPLPRPERWQIASKARSCDRSEEHTSELQLRSALVCRLLLEKT